MNPVLKNKGGKFYAKNKILPFFPKEINTYIEPFVGGGSIFLNLESFGIKIKTGCYINDLADEVFSLWRVFFEKIKIDELTQMLSDFSLYSESAFDYLLEFTPKNEVESVFKRICLTLLSYQGNAKNYYIGIGDVNRKMNKIYKADEFWLEYHKYLKRMNVKISKKDYSVFFQGAFNRAESFIYFDPPYVGTSGYDDLPFDMKAQQHLCNLVHEFKGKVVGSLNIDKDGWVKDNYSDLHLIPISTRWTGNIKSDKSKKVDEYLILNYNPADLNN